MTAEEIKKFGMQWYETFNTRNLDAICRLVDEFFSPDFRRYTLGSTDEPDDREGWKGTIHGVFKDFPDFHILVEDLIAGDDRLVTKGKYLGENPATKDLFNMHFINIVRMSEGKVVEVWELMAPISTLEAAKH
jgi:predicted ester cyclase